MKNKGYYINIISFVILSIFFMSCGGEEDSIPLPDVPRTAADVREDFSNLTFNVGINDVILESLVEGLFWKFRVIVPESASSSNKLPLVMRLHGGASAASADAHKSTDCLVSPGFEAIDTYIISPNSSGSLWYDEPNIVQVLALLDMAKENFHIDKDKVVVMGYSDGGNGSWFFAQFYSSLFSAAISMASSYDTNNTSAGIQPFAIPLYVIHGSEDTLFPLEITQGYVNASIDVGSDIQFETANGLGHFEPCEYVLFLRDAVSWLETEVWN